MIILAVDPGSKVSSYVLWNTETKTLDSWRDIPNAGLIVLIGQFKYEILGIEKIESYGMPVGKDIFETCVWCGRFMQRYYDREDMELIVRNIPRRDIKLHFCQDSRAKDSNIRQALIDRFGKPGTKKNPGITYGLAADLWQAFALAVYLEDHLA